jgi:hypothetical protein
VAQVFLSTRRAATLVVVTVVSRFQPASVAPSKIHDDTSFPSEAKCFQPWSRCGRPPFESSVHRQLRRI